MSASQETGRKAGAPAASSSRGWEAWEPEEIAWALIWAEQKYTAGSIAGMLLERFGTRRTASAVSTALAAARSVGAAKYSTPKVAKAAATAKAAFAAKRQADAANRTQRNCLRCERPFNSWGAGNRLCGPCRRSE